MLLVLSGLRLAGRLEVREYRVVPWRLLGVLTMARGESLTEISVIFALTVSLKAMLAFSSRSLPSCSDALCSSTITVTMAVEQSTSQGG